MAIFSKERKPSEIELDLEARGAALDEREERVRLAGSQLAQKERAFAEQVRTRREEMEEFRRGIEDRRTQFDREADAERLRIEDRRVESRKDYEVMRSEIERARHQIDEEKANAVQRLTARELELKKISDDLESRADELHQVRLGLGARDAELRDRERAVALAEHNRDAGWAAERAAKDGEFASVITFRTAELDARQVAIAEREANLARSEASYASRLLTLEDELSAIRNVRMTELDTTLLQERRVREKAMSEDLERIRVGAIESEHRHLELERGVIETERQRLRTEEQQVKERSEQAASEQLHAASELLLARQMMSEARELVAQREEEVSRRVASKEAAMEAKERVLEVRMDDVQHWTEAVRTKELEVLRESVAREVRVSESLRSQLASSASALRAHAELTRQLGRSPEEVLTEIDDLRDECGRLQIALAARYESESPERRKLLTQNAKLQETCHQLQQTLGEQQSAVLTSYQAAADLRRAEQQVLALEADLSLSEKREDKLRTELDRLLAGSARAAVRDERIAEIKVPVPVRQQRGGSEQPTELEWLNGLESSFKEAGFRFHPRILKAFHTSLKVSEWSPLTILAGVSGTGKSELPKLYARHGGIFFHSLPVMPNWDSQESMLGYFNSIDNRFDAQPVLRLLDQSQRPAEDGEGLSEHLVMVLLDELNLAHPELYFAEFLSKLETRRGERVRDVPSIEVKLGSGMEPHQIPLGRNVLWVGTMNQDETTKSLSDKVLDRSIIVPFPRPRRLQRRPELKPSTTAAPLLKRTVWHTWLSYKSTHTAMPQQYEAEMSRIKGSMERINGALSSAGRAIGHRVWQSIEYYLANYPDTIAASTEAELKDAMRNALEDQVVQKIIPKVRGVDTSGSGMRDCLQPIQTEFANMGYDDVVEDFKRSCGAGYGQFMWQSEAFLSDFDAESGADEA